MYKKYEEKWYGNEEEFIKNYRKMSKNQLEKYYNKSSSTINRIIDNIGFNRKTYVNTLTDAEVIFMYESLLNGEIKNFTNGFLKVENSLKYTIIIVRHLINDRLKWNKEDICNSFCNDTLKKYKLGAINICLGIGVYEVINISFPEYEIKQWELKNSSCDWNDDNLKEVKKWLKYKLKQDLDITSISKAGTYGFKNLIEKYNLLGLCATKYHGSYTKFMEQVYNEKFNKEEMLKINYTFDIKYKPISQTAEGKLYTLTDRYNNLDDRGKTLINEIIRYCEENGTFPNEKDLSKKNGYIPRTQYYKYFGGNNFDNVYIYILPKEKTPKEYCCNKCGETKPFNEEYFQRDNNSKFGFKKICKVCYSKASKNDAFDKLCKKYNINIKDKYSPIVWYEKSLEIEMKQLPKFCYSEENLIKIVRYVAFDKVKIIGKNDLLNRFNTNMFDYYRLSMIIYKLGGKFESFKKCFPEYDIEIINSKRRKYINDEIINNIFNDWIKANNISIIDILKTGLKDKLNKEMISLISNVFNTNINAFLWYFNYNNIQHPIYNREIVAFDFEEKSHGFWKVKENRVNRIRLYCENECKENILNTINDTEGLKTWVYKYFKQEDINKNGVINNYIDYVKSLYELLVEAYPQIQENYTLFDWEWHQFNRNDKETLIRELKEFILYRMNDIIIDLQTDIPKYINMHNIDIIYPKLNKHIDKKRFSSYYEWCCLAFSEYAINWKEQDFGNIISKDGNKFDSYIEKDVYEFIKTYSNIFKYITPIGIKHNKGKFVFELDDNYEQKKFCPDYVIEYVDIKNEKCKLLKPIIIEYYGLADFNRKDNKVINNYNKKTLAKEQFYKSRENIYYIGIFPEDIKQNFKGLVKKLSSFFMQNFNININKVT